MITGLRGASIWSQNAEPLIAFYRDTVGLPVLGSFDGFSVFGTPGLGTLLVGTHSEVSGPSADAFRHMVGLESTDIEADFARLSQAGVKVIEAPSMQGPNLMIATLQDPEGNIFQLLHSTE